MKKTIGIALVVAFVSLPGLYAQKANDAEKPAPISTEEFKKETNDIKRLLRDADKKSAERAEQIRKEQKEKADAQVAATKQLQDKLFEQQEADRIAAENKRKADMREIYIAVVLLVLFLVVLAVLTVRWYKNRPVEAVVRPRDLRAVEVTGTKYVIDSETGELVAPTVDVLRDYVEESDLYKSAIAVKRYFQNGDAYHCIVVLEEKDGSIKGQVIGDTSNEWIAWDNLPKRAARVMMIPKIS